VFILSHQHEKGRGTAADNSSASRSRVKVQISKIRRSWRSFFSCGGPAAPGTLPALFGTPGSESVWYMTGTPCINLISDVNSQYTTASGTTLYENDTRMYNRHIKMYHGKLRDILISFLIYRTFCH
jgi:hypothetical protein